MGLALARVEVDNTPAKAQHPTGFLVPARRGRDPSAPQRHAHRFGRIGAIRQRP